MLEGVVNFGDTLNGLSFLWQPSKDEVDLSPHRFACTLRFRKKLTGKSGNLRPRLCSNYTWHANSREGKQSRKLAAKEDRGEDQEWHGMSLNFTPSSILPSSAYHWLLAYFFFSWLVTAQLPPAVWLCPSFCQSFCYRLWCLNISSDCLCTCTWSNFEYMHHPARPVTVLNSSILGDFVGNNVQLTSTVDFWVRAPKKEKNRHTDLPLLNHIASLCPLRHFTWLPVEALVTCQQSAKLEWIHLKLLETVSAQVSFKWNTN